MAIKTAALNYSLPSLSVPLLSIGKFSCQQRISLRGNSGKCCVVRANVKKIEGASLHGHDKEVAETPPYVPVYVGLPLGIENDLVDPHILINWLRLLKSIDVDGVMVNCWWGIVEAHSPKQYNWSSYKRLFQIVRDLNLKLQVVMSFHGCSEDDVDIPLPRWVMEVGDENPDIFFTDSKGRRNHECLTWGIDNQRVLRDRTAIEVYFDYMQSFRNEFDEFFVDQLISEIEIGLGPCGELRYPSHSTQHGWKYPGIGEFQCYDKYLMTSLKNTRPDEEWGTPNNAGSYNSKPQETKFFLDRGDHFFDYHREDYDGFYGKFFFTWYSQVLIDHCDLVLARAKLALKDTPLSVKLPSIHWWCKTNCRAAELTAGIYTFTNRDGYAPITSMLKKHAAALKFTCADLPTSNQYKKFPEALGDPRAVLMQVLINAWKSDLPTASENALTCYDREGYNKLLEYATPFENPYRRHLRAFTYLRLGTELMKTRNFMEFERFVKGMHGERKATEILFLK